MKLCGRICLLLMSSVICIGQDNPCVLHLESPKYPDLARQAQLSGTVRVIVTVGEDGRVLAADASGPRLLKEEALRNSQTWTFSRGPSRKFEVTYEFRLEEPRRSYRPVPEVQFDFPGRVTIISHAPAPIRDGVTIRPTEK